MGFNNKKGAARGGRRVQESLYDDTDYTYARNRVAVENSRTRVKESKQTKADGSRFAPWMDIDEKLVEKTRKEREEVKRKTGKFFG